MSSKDRVSILPLVIAIGVLVLAISFFRCPYWYYTLVRIVTMLVAAYLVYKYCANKKFLLALVCLLIIATFQPFYKLPIGRGLWGLIDFAVLVFWFASFGILSDSELKSEEDNTESNDDGVEDKRKKAIEIPEPDRICYNNEWWWIAHRSFLKNAEIGLVKYAKYVEIEEGKFGISFSLISGQEITIPALYSPDYKKDDYLNIDVIEILTIHNTQKGKKEIAWTGGSLIAIRHIIPAPIKEVSKTAPVNEVDDLKKSGVPYYIFFDTESTGLPIYYKAPASDVNNWPRLVQIAWILTDYNGNVLKKTSRLICPNNYRISDDAIRIHGITNEYAKQNGIALNSVIEEFGQDLVKAKVKVAHNIEFDNNVIHAEFIRIGKEDVWNSGPQVSICTMKSSTNYCKIPHDYYGYKYPSLHELYMKLFNERLEGAHNALTDIEATCKCFFELRLLSVIK